MPVEAGLTPGVMLAVRVVGLPAATGLGLADPVPKGAPVSSGVREKSSTARPSSAPLASVSVQRIQMVAPGGMLTVMEAPRAVLSAAALPFLAPTVAVSGVTKLRAGTPAQVPLTRSVAVVLYSKLSWSVRAAVPRRHSSPV